MSGVVRYLLDTNILSDLINRGRNGPVAAMLEGRTANVCTSIVAAAEIRYGVARKGSPSLAGRAETVLGTIPIAPLAAPADRYYGDIRALLTKRGTPIGPNDLLIAAQCLALNLCLVSANLSEFRRVPGLEIENWLDPHAVDNGVH
ncbi:type II toxin-antitoxin system VapC family toxin [Methylobacterium sp. J-048]|uniref:type II toxin-antitoxin system VapC family toxin n=1 Tax=Methylobacterium sp. J-048 TaxID=2836635 RepID=UPI001FBAA13A|nr:type II toxin-antitoxin system VapC family toxin [Methylobacterium sp. J-048]MCJ2060355.1 type II toxin-antitoxin system VapC family toxin [Methylobacterium sp. J-048]